MLCVVQQCIFFISFYFSFHQATIYMYGGMVSNSVTSELWAYSIKKNEWSHSKNDRAVAVVGHTAHLIDGIMYVIFGHSPIYGYMNTVQECNMCK